MIFLTLLPAQGHLEIVGFVKIEGGGAGGRVLLVSSGQGSRKVLNIP